jgi:peptidoglycan/LPS O-acetylase OafA/YrhL
MQQTHKKLDTILLFGGIAIFLIVLYHELVGQLNNPLISLNPYFIAMGLSLFTFSSGYKLMINHSNELDQRVFLNEYYMKRFVRLYKPYIGYTLLMVFPLLLISYLAINYLHLDYPGIKILTFIDSMNSFSLINFLCGTNPIAAQLWYLISLIVITSICFTILYFLNIKWLFFFFFPFILISLIIQFKDIYMSQQIAGVYFYLPFFILGSFSAYHHQYQMEKWTKIFQIVMPAIFLILVLSTILSQNFIDKSILIYISCFFFPFFLFSVFDQMKKIKFLYSFLIFCGTYSFQIYLFQWPLILPIISRIIIDILKIDYIFIPILITILAIYVCVIVYEIIKKIHLNILFE